MATREPAQQFFDRRARDYYRDNYEQPHNRHAYNLMLRRQACLELVPPAGGLVLDLGCGPGAMLVPLAQAGHRVIASDLSPAMVAEAARRLVQLGQPSRAVVASATELPFADGSLAAVVTTGVLEYVPDLRAAMAEIARVLAPGGTAICTMSLPRRLERFTTRVVAQLRGGAVSVPQYIFGRREFDDVIEASGLAIDARRCCAFAPFPVDAIWPRSVLWIDRWLGRALNHSAIACDHAKTYIVRAIR
jgi:ubiquinone/menaquinone biosynthesis C-methylase UbiE